MSSRRRPAAAGALLVALALLGGCADRSRRIPTELAEGNDVVTSTSSLAAASVLPDAGGQSVPTADAGAGTSARSDGSGSVLNAPVPSGPDGFPSVEASVPGSPPPSRVLLEASDLGPFWSRNPTPDAADKAELFVLYGLVHCVGAIDSADGARPENQKALGQAWAALSAPPEQGAKVDERSTMYAQILPGDGAGLFARSVATASTCPPSTISENGRAYERLEPSTAPLTVPAAVDEARLVVYRSVELPAGDEADSLALLVVRKRDTISFALVEPGETLKDGVADALAKRLNPT